MASIAKNARPYGGGHFFITLDNDGGKTAWIKDVEGGNAEGEIITEKVGSTHIAQKSISNVKYNDCTFKIGGSGTPGLYSWIESSFSHKHNESNGGLGRTNGEIVCCDYDYKETSSLSFQNAIVTEFGMPALDAAGKDQAAMTVKFTPEMTRYKTGGTRTGIGQKGGISPIQKHWTNANFRLSIDGIDDDSCGKVTKIDALTVKQKVVQHYTGKKREYEIEATSVETPNLVITLAESFAKPFFDWHEDFVIKGNCSDKGEKQGSLEYLPQNVEQGPLFSLQFVNLGVFKISAEKVEVGDKIRYVKVEMYCEEIKLKYHKPA